MKTAIRFNRPRRYLELRHMTDAHTTGILTVPFDGPIANERVFNRNGLLVHEADFDASCLGEGDIEPYLIGMTRSVERKAHVS